MSGFVSALSRCFGCKRLFSYNPARVPSITPPGKTFAEREPVCADCIERANPKRIAGGLAPIVPLPGAYDACDESELG